MTKQEIMNMIEFDEKTQTLKLNIKDNKITIDARDSVTKCVDFSRAKTTDVIFEDATTWDVNFNNAATDYVIFENATTSKVTFENAETGYVTFENATTRNVNFSRSTTEDVHFKNAETGYIDFNGTETSNVYFEDAKTEKVYFIGTEMKDYIFEDKIKIDGEVYERDFTDGVNIGITKIICRSRITKLEGVNYRGNKVFLYKTENLAYHSDVSMEDAKNGYKRKLEKLKEGVGKWVKTLKPNSIITDEIFHKQTGSCFPGIRAWKEKVGIADKKKITFKEFKKLAKNNPTSETKSVMAAIEVMKEMSDVKVVK